MKQYLKALQEYETNNDRFDQLCHYMNVTNSAFIKQYREGAINLPSFIMIKKLHSKYSDLCSQDEELNNLFLNATECSKLFYARTITLIKNYGTNGKEFETGFKHTSQPLGQSLINLLINIKYRRRIARFKRQRKQNNDINKIFHKLSGITEPINCWINNVIYKASLIQSTHYRLTKKLYYLVVALAVLSLILMNSLFYQQFSFTSIVTLNTLLCSILGTTAVIMHPGGDFENIDISGKNMIAYKYRAFFNNIANKKMHNIFIMQHAHEFGHKLNQNVESIITKA